MKPYLPNADQILGPVLDKFYELRPRSLQHINLRTGTYWHPFLGFRAQAAKSLFRVADLVKNGNLATAEGRDLIDYVNSEFRTVPDTTPTTAIGEASFKRTTTTRAGDIPAGKRITRAANPTTQIPIAGADYELLAPVHFDVGQTTTGLVPVRALSPGVAPNHPVRTDSVDHGAKISGVFDTTITVDQFSAAGGSDGSNDDYIKRFAHAYAQGQYGPTSAASYLGALSVPGVRRVLVYDIPSLGLQKILVADAGWASSARWVSYVQQAVFDSGVIGHGCKVSVGLITNKVISVEASIAMRDTGYLADTSEVDNAVRTAVRAYFDERPDWNIWKKNSLKAVVARAHPKILNCTLVTVRDVSGTSLDDIASADYTQTQYHYHVGAGAVNITYSGPG